MLGKPSSDSSLTAPFHLELRRVCFARADESSRLFSYCVQRLMRNDRGLTTAEARAKSHSLTDKGQRPDVTTQRTWACPVAPIERNCGSWAVVSTHDLCHCESQLPEFLREVASIASSGCPNLLVQTVEALNGLLRPRSACAPSRSVMCLSGRAVETSCH